MSIKYVHSCKNTSQCHVKNHICQIILQRDLERVKKLIKEPKYYCKNCGRASHEKINLCNPSKL